ncbi:MAG: hypothetical protein K2L98_03135, partial [Bacilli bacterium]|nr:hypothetical protein [Bacilli bacterium]
MISYKIIDESSWFYGEEIQKKYYAIRSNPDLSFVRIWGSLFDSDDFVLKARANNIYYCSCPFHNAKDYPVCIDENQKGFYYYGCGRGGTIISAIAEHFDIDRDEAVNILYAYMTNNVSSLSQEELAILNKIING